MDSDMPIMKGSICPLCRSQMFFDQTEGKAVLKCSIEECDYNDKVVRDEYFREKHKSLIMGDVMHKVKDRPKLRAMLNEEQIE